MLLVFNKYSSPKINRTLFKHHITLVNKNIKFNNIIKLSRDKVDPFENNNIIYDVDSKDCSTAYVRLTTNTYGRSHSFVNAIHEEMSPAKTLLLKKLNRPP